MRHETARALLPRRRHPGDFGQRPAGGGRLAASRRPTGETSGRVPRSARVSRGPGLAAAQLAFRLIWANKHEEDAELRRLVLADWEKLAADFPTVPHYQQSLAYAHTNLGIALKDALGRMPEAEQHYRQALAVWKKFRANFPNTPEDR